MSKKKKRPSISDWRKAFKETKKKKKSKKKRLGWGYPGLDLVRG